MIDCISKRPPFIGLEWTYPPQGYKFLRSVPNSVFTESQWKFSDNWLQLLTIFNQVQHGQFDNLHLLLPLIRESADFHIRSASLRILGDASSESNMMAIVEFFAHPDPDTRFVAYSAAASTASLDLARSLVEASNNIKSSMELDLLADAVSEILEPEPDKFIEPRNLEEYQSIALGRIREIEAQVEKGKPVMFGKILDIRNIIFHIRQFVADSNSEDYNDLSIEYLLKFEAMTGIWSKEWFDVNGIIDTSKVLFVLDEFESSYQANNLVKGIRYFFSHPIPRD